VPSTALSFGVMQCLAVDMMYGYQYLKIGKESSVSPVTVHTGTYYTFH
jgi:hypothetical protein